MKESVINIEAHKVGAGKYGSALAFAHIYAAGGILSHGLLACTILCGIDAAHSREAPNICANGKW